MAILPGARLGPYEITSAIGAGGMGEVYSARDTRLNRNVALKVLPDVFAHDAERMARFEREAKLLASLNHPYIASIYGLEESRPTRALVMELVEGPTLAERIAAGPIPLDEALPIAKQVAEALEYAHDHGVIHRDLKPANIKVTAEGTVKVLDFGLAKAMSGDLSEADMANSPTLSMAATRQGVILGTAAYMSPEQARGKQVDKRTDIWAYGAVLYEMLTGKQAFHGDDVTDVLAAVVRAEPDWNRLSPSTPVKVRDLLWRCLQKDKTLRMQAAGDARIEIQEALAAPKDANTTHAGSAPKNKPLLAVAAITTIIALTLGAFLWRATRPIEEPLKPLVRLDVDLGPDVLLGSLRGADVILSPDGTRLVYVSQGKLFTRRLDQPKATDLAGTDGAYAPFFSPDGQWVAFFAGGKLKKVSVEGGAVIDLCATEYGAGGSWGEDGNIIAALNMVGGLTRIPSAGGAPTSVTELAEGEATHRWPQILPGGQAVLFTTNTLAAGFEGANIEVLSLADHRRKTLHRGGTYGRYLPSGHLVYISRGTLFAVPFDLETLEVRGTPKPVLDAVGYSATNGSARFDFSRNGTLVYRYGGEGGGGLLTVQWLDGAGKIQPLLAKPDTYMYPRLSPNGQRLALDTTGDVWIYNWQRDTMTRLTFGGANGSPVWSPDGRYIAFRANGGISWTRSDGAGKPQLLSKSKSGQDLQIPYSFTPDGKRLAFHENASGTGFDLWTLPLETGSAGLRAGKPEVFLRTKFNERQPFFSPDGRWLAYVSDESGRYQVYVRAFPDKGGKWQISNNGGMCPVFSHNGQELLFETDDNRIMVASYTAKGDSFVADKPQVWSEKRIGGNTRNGTSFYLAPDGKRIAVLMPVDKPGAQKEDNQVIFLENFFDEVRRRASSETK